MQDAVQVSLHILYRDFHLLLIDLLGDGADMDRIFADGLFQPFVLRHFIDLLHGHRPILGENGIEVYDLTEEGGQKLLVRLSVYGVRHRFQIALDVLLQIHLADGIDAVFLVVGKPRQPFGRGQQPFRKAVDDHCPLGIDSIRLIPLDGGFVDPDPLSQLRHGQLEFCPALFDPFSDLFRAEHFFCLQGVHLLTYASITQRNLICNP